MTTASTKKNHHEMYDIKSYSFEEFRNTNTQGKISDFEFSDLGKSAPKRELPQEQIRKERKIYFCRQFTFLSD